MRVLGIDFGERRIGLALSDPEGRWALPLTSIERRTDRQAAYQIASIAQREEVELLVIGEPRHPNGAPSDLAERVRRFSARLERAARLPIESVGEALTTVEADDHLRAAGVPNHRRGAVIDSVAAQILLQEALDRRRNLS